ncbi:LEAF RUST 10 DISEASE-RESISTANCE LOCUS RECEPTOR-LIKE PROTEIN KINASE-like 2.7 [Lolium rigidum]|uniref:LEAF RUST 10 DISEASE-RESISTANCE LOCUS RECEPTOR-LIKE PROTEIN KINASE-like 2.7 n=1 Tax=Lolium rigidum TaxID=89674 RepID=UPI001F5D7557|nr:LEAF RUST 10 DISEASE-RESISTANCE LOCUS RECEPTOR-LIKE PROTEIN KINASE-like 2.7 [Lolium rigidum]
MHHLLLPAVVLLFAAAKAYAASCSDATCGGQTISYPFWLANSGPNCGYPGLGISCQDNTPILDHQFHQYRVLRIDYTNRTVALADADAWNTTCPRLTFSLSPDPNSWLQLTRSNFNLTVLYHCKAKLPRPSAVKLDGCPDQSDTWYVLPDDGVTGKAYGHGCEKAVTTPVLLSSAHRLAANPSLGEVLSAGFEMRYDAKNEQCGACEQSGGRCRYGRIEEHGGTGFACVCDDGANERQCGDAQSLRLKRQKIYKIASTSSEVLICLVLLACLLGYKKYHSALSASHLPCSFQEPAEVSLSLLAGDAGFGSSI